MQRIRENIRTFVIRNEIFALHHNIHIVRPTLLSHGSEEQDKP